ncbi:hypothetical protein TrRE_jg8777, partial [Triparma retinervis]
MSVGRGQSVVVESGLWGSIFEGVESFGGCTVFNIDSGEEDIVDEYINAMKVITEAEKYAKEEKEDVVVMWAGGGEVLEGCWRLADEVLKEYKSSEGTEWGSYDIDGSRSEGRAFYGTAMQRAGRYRSGGSLTLMMEVDGQREKVDATGIWVESDFSDRSEKVKTRIAVMAKAGITLDVKNLEKVGIPAPGLQGGEGRLIEDLMSLSDGQLLGDDTVDVTRSITRIG